MIECESFTDMEVANIPIIIRNLYKEIKADTGHIRNVLLLLGNDSEIMIYENVYVYFYKEYLGLKIKGNGYKSVYEILYKDIGAVRYIYLK